jgi:hypothetical protein
MTDFDNHAENKNLGSRIVNIQTNYYIVALFTNIILYEKFDCLSLSNLIDTPKLQKGY